MSKCPPLIIPAWLDDFGLTSIDFRVYCHLSRRRGLNEHAWPNGDSIADVCRICPDTVWTALRSLETKGLLIRKKRFGTSNRYNLLVPPSITGKQGVIDKPQSLETEGFQSAESEGRQSAETGGLQSAERKGLKGESMKEKKLRRVSERAPAPTSFNLVLSEAERHEAILEFHFSDSGLDEAIRIFSQNKSPFPQDQRDFGAFCGWLRRTTDGRKAAAQYRRVSSPEDTPATGSTSLPAPENWSERIAGDEDLKRHSGRKWDQINNYYQREIIKFCGKNPP